VSAAGDARAFRVFRTDPLVLGAVGALGLVTLVLVFVGNGDFGLALAPLGLGLLLLAVARAPLRHSLLVLGFLCLVLENPGEVPASGKWNSPLHVVGALLLAHINYTIPVKALFFSGVDLALLLFAGVWVFRRMTFSEIDVRGHIAPARPLRLAALLCLGTILVIWGFGVARGGADLANSFWQVARIVYLPCVFLLFCAGLRGTADSRPLGIALLVAALLRACVAIYVRHLFPNLDEVPHATIHADSMLFADAFLLVLVMFFERPTLRTFALLLGTLPILSWGMVANNRRLVWAELIIGLLPLYFITPLTRLKRKIVQGVALALPVIAIYLAVGWNSTGRAFAPVRIIRSIVDSKADASTLWRDMENYNLAWTLRDNPLLGSGFGHPYEEVIHLPDISGAYSLYRFVPHNSVLAAFAYGGIVGFIGMWLILPLGVFFAVRAYRFSTTPRERTTALTTVGIIVAYFVHCYGDMGLGTWTSVFTVAPALALVGKQAVATGAWPFANTRLVNASPGPLVARPGAS
jgi:hypothetical protein